MQLFRKPLLVTGGYLKMLHVKANMCKIFNGESSVYINIFLNAFKNHTNMPYKCPLEPVNILLSALCARTINMELKIKENNLINFPIEIVCSGFRVDIIWKMSHIINPIFCRWYQRDDTEFCIMCFSTMRRISRWILRSKHRTKELLCGS